ncbi:MAG: hypothetical protein WC614_07740 [bacterium]
MECLYCGKEITTDKLEKSDNCPHCGQQIYSECLECGLPFLLPKNRKTDNLYVHHACKKLVFLLGNYKLEENDKGETDISFNDTPPAFYVVPYTRYREYVKEKMGKK